MSETLTDVKWTQVPRKSEFSRPTPTDYLTHNDSLIRQYAEAARRHARAEDLGDDGWYADVVGLDGVYGEGATRDEAEADLEEAVVAWLEVKVRHGDAIPPMDGFEF